MKPGDPSSSSYNINSPLEKSDNNSLIDFASELKQQLLNIIIFFLNNSYLFIILSVVLLFVYIFLLKFKSIKLYLKKK